MEKPNYEMWRNLEKLTVSQAAYLICDREPPDVPPSPPGFVMMRPLKDVPDRPQIVDIWLDKLRKAIDAGDLKLTPESTGWQKYVTMTELRRFIGSTGLKPELFFPPKTDSQPEAKPTERRCPFCNELLTKKWPTCGKEDCKTKWRRKYQRERKQKKRADGEEIT